MFPSSSDEMLMGLRKDRPDLLASSSSVEDTLMGLIMERPVASSSSDGLSTGA